MAKLELSDIGVFVKDLKAARAFFTRKVGLKVRGSMPKWGYLALGATKGGDDASLNVWQPTPDWGDTYESSKTQIGGVTGIGFLTTDLKRTVEALKKKGVKAAVDAQDAMFGRFTDPDGNVLFLSQPRKSKVHRVGLSALAFVTVASRDSKKTGEFFTKALGLKKQRVPAEEGGEDFTTYSVTPKATGIMPFTPRKDIYTDAKDYDEDMAHIGEDTSIGFSTKDIYATQDALMAKGVRFQKKAEKRPWGGIQAKFFDPDENVYALYQYDE